MEDVILKRLKSADSFTEYEKDFIVEYKEIMLKIYVLGWLDSF